MTLKPGRRGMTGIGGALLLVGMLIASAAPAMASAAPDFEMPFPIDRLRFGDFDGDGKTDVFYTSGTKFRVSYGGTSAWTDLKGSSLTIDRLRFGDFDGDGKTDVFYTSGTKFRVSYGGTSAWTDLAGSSLTVDALGFGDFDGDGKTDVFYTNTTGTDFRVSYGGTSAWTDLEGSIERLGSSGFEMTEVSPGDSGPAVEYLQRLLTHARLYRGPIDGRYPNDPWQSPGNMMSAVYAFHKLYQAPQGDAWTMADHVSPLWTIEDWQRLRSFTPEPPVARAGEPDRFEVDAHHELMWLILDGEVAAIFHVSVGGEFTYRYNGSYQVAHTPRGDLDVQRYRLPASRTVAWNQLYMYRAWDYLFTHRWMALHGYRYVPPYPASHGCVRVVFDDADWIYAEVGAGIGVPFHIWDR